MKLHRILVDAAAQGIDKIFKEGKYADDVVEKVINSDKRWGAKDRRFIAETIYDVVRNYSLYNYCAESNEAWRILEARFVVMQVPLPAWEGVWSLDFVKVTELYGKAQENVALRYSIPDWLQQRGIAEVGLEKWNGEMAAMHYPAKVCLRVNTLKTTLENAKKQLESEGLNSTEVDGALVLEERKNLNASVAFKAGWVEVQDVNSQKIGLLLNPQPGQFVIDACAGAGGKSLQMAALMQNKGSIFALDIFDVKLAVLQQRAHRAGAKNIKCALMDFTTQNHLFEKADKLLLDVPCSGTGVLRRKPDTKWKLTEASIEDTTKTQWQILSSYHSMLKKGGEMVYATCSILPSENQKQVERFLKEFNGSFELVNELFLSPAETGFDGFYMALIKKVR